MALKEIGKFTLHNGGGFVARGKVAYMTMTVRST